MRILGYWLGSFRQMTREEGEKQYAESPECDPRSWRSSRSGSTSTTRSSTRMFAPLHTYHDYPTAKKTPEWLRPLFWRLR
jgi:hypothetical protein